MTLQELMGRLQESVDHGQNPSAQVLLWDPDEEAWCHLTGYTLSATEVLLYSDEP